MIIAKNVIINGTEYRKTYSDSGFQIRKIGTNEIYDESIDLPELNYQYEETNTLVEIMDLENEGLIEDNEIIEE